MYRVSGYQGYQDIKDIGISRISGYQGYQDIKDIRVVNGYQEKIDQILIKYLTDFR